MIRTVTIANGEIIVCAKSFCIFLQSAFDMDH